MLSVSVIAQSAILTKIKIKMVRQTPHKMLPSSSRATVLASICLHTMSQSLITWSYRKLQPQWQELRNITSNKTQGKEHTGLLLPTASTSLRLHQHLPDLSSCYSQVPATRGFVSRLQNAKADKNLSIHNRKPNCLWILGQAHPEHFLAGLLLSSFPLFSHPHEEHEVCLCVHLQLVLQTPQFSKIQMQNTQGK